MASQSELHKSGYLRGLSVNVDNKSIMINDEGQLAVREKALEPTEVIAEIAKLVGELYKLRTENGELRKKVQYLQSLLEKPQNPNIADGSFTDWLNKIGSESTSSPSRHSERKLPYGKYEYKFDYQKRED